MAMMKAKRHHKWKDETENITVNIFIVYFCLKYKTFGNQLFPFVLFQFKLQFLLNEMLIVITGAVYKSRTEGACIQRNT